MFTSETLFSDLIKTEKLVSSCDCNGILACCYADGIARLVFNLGDWSTFSFVAFNSQLLGVNYASEVDHLIFWG